MIVATVKKGKPELRKKGKVCIGNQHVRWPEVSTEIYCPIWQQVAFL
jgi:hypothetical protein